MNIIRPLACIVPLITGLAWTTPAETVSIKGSNTFGEELAPALIDAYTAKHPDVTITLETAGSGTGIAALLEGACDIASSSRNLNEDETRLARSRNMIIDPYVVGYYGIGMIVHRSNPVKALTDKQVEAIFTGDVTNWKEVGGRDAPINLYIRNASAGTYLGFQELAMNYRPYSEDALEKPSYAEISAAVHADPNAIGYVSLNMIQADGVHGVIINGIHPSTSAVVEGLYPYARMVRLFVNRDVFSPAARDFVRFMQSREGQKIVEGIGFAPRFSAHMDMGGIRF